MLKKKASLEISIQAIVIVVLAMTLLGLGLGFIRGMFGKLVPLNEDISDQVRQQILEDLKTGDKKLSFPKSELTIEKGKSTILHIGIKKKENEALYYTLNFAFISPAILSDGSEQTYIDDAFENWFQIPTPSTGSWLLDTADSDIRSIKINIRKNVLAGSYPFSFSVINTAFETGDPDYIYAQKDFFITVTG